MMREYLAVSRSSKDETTELEKLASQLSISETPQEVNVLQPFCNSLTKFIPHRAWRVGGSRARSAGELHFSFHSEKRSTMIATHGCNKIYYITSCHFT